MKHFDENSSRRSNDVANQITSRPYVSLDVITSEEVTSNQQHAKINEFQKLNAFSSANSINAKNNDEDEDFLNYCDDYPILNDVTEIVNCKDQINVILDDIDTSSNFIETERRKFSKDLASVFVSAMINHKQGDMILNVLRTQDNFGYLPKSTKTLLKTPRKAVQVRIVEPGEYLHIGLKSAIIDILDHFCTDETIPLELNIDFSTDGGDIDKKKVVWPILCRIPDLSLSAVKVVGVYVGRKKPLSCDEFFETFIDEALQIMSDGSFIYKEREVRVKFRLFIADAPARAFALKHKSHVSRYPCSKCIVRGKTIYMKNKRKLKRHMVFCGTNFPLRTTVKYHAHDDLKHQFPGKSPLQEILNSLVMNVPFEYMHLVLLGVMKKLLSVWIDGEHNRYLKLGKEIIKTINRILLLLTEYCPEEYERDIDEITKYGDFKATQYRQIIFASGIVIFRRFLPKYAYDHFLLLHSSMRCLAYYAKSERHLLFAEIALKKFVERAAEIYNPSFNSYNVHGLLHLVSDVRNFGNIDSFSSFPFENVMGRFKKLVRKPESPLQQISNRLVEISRNVQDENYSISSCKNEPHYNKRHYRDIVPIGYEQYDLLKCNGFTWRTRSPDNCIIVDSIVYVIKNILRDKNSSYFTVSRFETQMPYYDIGIKSTEIGVYRLANLQNYTTIIHVNEFISKCFLIPCNNDIVNDYNSALSSDEETEEEGEFVAVVM